MSEDVNKAQIVYGKKWVEDELCKQLKAAVCKWRYNSAHEVFLLTVEFGGKKLKEKFFQERLEDCKGTPEVRDELKRKVSDIVKAFGCPEQKYEKHLFVSERIAVKAFVNKVRVHLGGLLCELSMFGSKVEGTHDLDSDIDILLVIDSDDWRVRHSISDIAADIDIEYDSNISPVIYTKTEYDKNLYSNTLFVQEVGRTGVPL